MKTNKKQQKLFCTGAEYIIRFLEHKGIQTIAGIPGGANLPLYDALYRSNIRHILVRHEQAAGFIAQGIARTTGKTAVCFATSGPGATNLITAIADAHLDSIPVIAITGQVAAHLIGTDAFQEIDTYGLSLPITKHNYLINHIEELADKLSKAFCIAGQGRPGPVWIDVPKNIFQELHEFPHPSCFDTESVSNPNTSIDPKDIERLKWALHSSKRPLIIAGGGIRHPESKAAILQLMHKQQIPLVHTLRGYGIIDSDHPANLGMIGMHGHMQANQAVEAADLILALGMRFDDRATGNIHRFAPHATIVHIDQDASELNKLKPAHIPLNYDLRLFLPAFASVSTQQIRTEWLQTIEQIKQEYPHLEERSRLPMNHPLSYIKQISDCSASDCIVTTDVGQHQMWVAQAFGFHTHQHFLTSGGLGTMGFGLPTAIGAALANPDKIVYCFTGDGSLLMNIQELGTLAETNANVVIFLFDNQTLGLVHQQQTLFFNAHHSASTYTIQTDFVQIAHGFGLQAIQCLTQEELSNILSDWFKKKGPLLIHIPTNREFQVLPMVTPGGSNTEMIVYPLTQNQYENN